MSFKYRVKTYKDEDGEYSEYQSADKEIILKLINDHWTNETTPNNLEIISIANNSGEHLMLEHFQKHVFDVYYLPTQKEFHFHKKSTIDIVYNSVELFFSNSQLELENSLNKTKEENKYVHGDFFFIDHNYRYTRERELKELIWLIFAIPLAIMFLGVGIASLFAIPFFGVILIPIGLYVIIPGLLIHQQYKKDIDGLTIRLTKGQEKIKVVSNSWRKELNKSDIIKVTKYSNPATRNPWSDYEYIEIEFKSGEIINLTNLITDQLHILEKFKNDRLTILKVDDMAPYIRRRTKVN